MSDVYEHRFTPIEIAELANGTRRLAFFTDVAGWFAFDEFRADAAAAGLVCGVCYTRWPERGRPTIRMMTLMIARPDGTWRFAKAAFVARARAVGRYPDRDWPDRMMAELIGRSPTELRHYLRRERRSWQIRRLKRRRRQTNRRLIPRSW